jgi:hypothetical protein
MWHIVLPFARVAIGSSGAASGVGPLRNGRLLTGWPGSDRAPEKRDTVRTSGGPVHDQHRSGAYRGEVQAEVVPAAVEVWVAVLPPCPLWLGAFGADPAKIDEGGPPDEQATGWRGRIG